MKLRKKDSPENLLDEVRLAKNPWQRMRGLLGTDSLQSKQGLWLIPCNSIHTFGMAYPIDVLYLDKNNKIVRMVSELVPNRMGPVIWKAHSVLEMMPGTLRHSSLKLGDELVLCSI